MSDISKCNNRNCPLKEKCYRFTAPANPYRQSYADFTYDEKEGCEYFWDNKERQKTKKNEISNLE